MAPRAQLAISYNQTGQLEARCVRGGARADAGAPSLARARAEMVATKHAEPLSKTLACFEYHHAPLFHSLL